MRRPGRTQQKSGGVARRCRELQAPHRFAVGLHAPAQNGGGGVTVQRLFGGPQCIQFFLVASLLDDQQAFERHAGGGQRAGMQRMRRRDQDQPAIIGAELLAGRQQQRKFALPSAVAEQFGQRAARPASARQFAIQRRKSACHRR